MCAGYDRLQNRRVVELLQALEMKLMAFASVGQASAWRQLGVSATPMRSMDRTVRAAFGMPRDIT
jgi:hypothetical protein